MIAVSYSTVRQNFKEYCDRATKDFETIIITRTRGENVVMLSEAEYNNLIENFYIWSNPIVYNELLGAIENYRQGNLEKFKQRELIDE